MTSWRDLSWTTKLTIVLVASAIVPLTLVTLYNRTTATEERLAAARANDRQRAHGTAEVIDTYLSNLQADMRLAATSPAVVALMATPSDGDARSETTAALRDIKDVQAYADVFVLDRSGVVIASTSPRLLGRSFATHRVFVMAMAGDTVVEDPELDRETGRYFLHVSSPIRRGGPILGVIVAGIETAALERYVASDTNFGGIGEFGVLWNEQGVRLVAPSDAARQFERFDALPPYSALMPGAGAAGHTADGSGQTKWLHSDLGDVPSMLVDMPGTGRVHASVVPLKTKRWVYGIFAPEARIVASLEAQTRRGLFVALIVGLVVIALSTIAAGWVVRPIRLIGRAANAIAAGDMTRRVGLTQSDEIGALATAFDRMADTLAAKDAQLQSRADELERRVEQRTAALAFIARASSVLASSLDLEATLTSVAKLAVPALADYCLIDLLTETGELRPVRTLHASAEKTPVLERLRSDFPPRADHPAAVVTHTGKPILLEQVSDADLARIAPDSEHFARVLALMPRSAIIVPLVASGGAMGAITLVRSETDRPYTESDLALAEDLANRCGLAVDHARLYRQAQEANRLKDEFLGTVSHELRTPLNAMLGWARMLRTHTLDERRSTRALETIERNAQVQAQLIDDLLDVSRIISGKLPLDMRSVNLSAVIESAVEATRPAADAKQIRIDMLFAPDVGSFLGDPNRLQQVVWNLLSNAIKFTPAGGSVRVSLERTDDAIEIRVADTGAGIARDFLPFVFDRFRQADSTTTRQHGGLGLGLAIVRHLVELHGGTVKAESDGPGMGSTFTVRLPAIRAVRSDVFARVPPGRELNVDPQALAGVHVLIVDDHADARELAATVLERHGARTQVASSVREALDAVHRGPVDVLVADLGMPQEDGYSLLERLRRDQEPRVRQIPAVALTAYASDHDRRRSADAGFVKHLAKPVEPGDLVRAVAEALQTASRT